MLKLLAIRMQKYVLAWTKSRLVGKRRKLTDALKKRRSAVQEDPPYGARKNSRNEQRGYKDTSVYTEEGYRLN